MSNFTNYHSAYIFDELTKRCYASAQFTDLTNRWPWIKETVASYECCSTDDICCIETDDGDKITAQGRIVAFVCC